MSLIRFGFSRVNPKRSRDDNDEDARKRSRESGDGGAESESPSSMGHANSGNSDVFTVHIFTVLNCSCWKTY